MGDGADSLQYPMRGYFPTQANDSCHPLTRGVDQDTHHESPYWQLWKNRFLKTLTRTEQSLAKTSTVNINDESEKEWMIFFHVVKEFII